MTAERSLNEEEIQATYERVQGSLYAVYVLKPATTRYGEDNFNNISNSTQETVKQIRAQLTVGDVEVWLRKAEEPIIEAWNNISSYTEEQRKEVSEKANEILTLYPVTETLFPAEHKRPNFPRVSHVVTGFLSHYSPTFAPPTSSEEK